ncbi:Cell division protein SepF [Candidatus Tiddalikarchaeum anstoanum]|nr:Cell division protein SepF [Candidatus Tiddalikarchaeum anstoanum]
MAFDFLKNIAEKLSGTTHLSYNETQESPEEDYVEVTPQKDTGKAKVQIKYMVITDFADIKPILDYVREGYYIIFAKIKELRSKDVTELKRAILKIKKTCEAVGGDVVGIDEDFLLVIPGFVKVSKEDIEQ